MQDGGVLLPQNSGIKRPVTRALAAELLAREA
jgi:hypothetical protein